MSTADNLKGIKNAPILGKSTYNRWSRLFSICLYWLNLEKFISDELPELCDENEPKSSKTLQKSAKTSGNNVRAALLQVVPEELYNILESLPTALLMWILLKTDYQPKAR